MSRSHRIALGFHGAASVIGLVSLLLLLLHGYVMVAWPLQLEFGEGVVIHMMDEVARGGALYRDPQTLPWFVCGYNPLFIWLGSLLYGILGPTWAAGRLISWLAALGTVGVVGLAAARRGGRWAGLAASSIFACSALVIGWSVLCRVDFLGVFLEALGLACADRVLRRMEAGGSSGGEASPSAPGAPAWGAVAAGLCFALAFWSKQNMLIGMVAATVVLISRRAWKPVLAMVATWALAVGLPWVVLDHASGGRLFGFIFGYHRMPWSFEGFRMWLGGYLPTVAVAFAASVVGLAGGLGREARLARLWAVYLLLSVSTLVLGGKEGAYYNYFLPFQVAVSVMGGLALGSGARLWPGVALCLQLGVAFNAALPPTLPPPREYLVREAPFVLRGGLEARWWAAMGQLRELKVALEPVEGPIVAENVGNLVLAGRRPVIDDPFFLFQVARQGGWDARPLEQMIRERRIGAFVLQRPDEGNPRFPADLMRLILENYRPVRKIGEDFVLLPSPR